MNKSFATALVATAAACFSIGALAADSTDTTDSTTLTKSQAKDLTNQSNAQYKANKKVAGANEDLNKADCSSSTTGSVKRACKSDAAAQAKEDKADAKLVNSAQKDAIKSDTTK